MKVDLAAIAKLAEEKLVNTQRHDKWPLLIHNYTPVAQYERRWDDLTRMCRGLITDLEGNVICRPFPKFFNIEEHDGEDSKLPKLNWNQKFTCTEKLDGSLGIAYLCPDDLWRIATRGSFSSDQAIRATEIFLNRVPSDMHPACMDHKFTYLFEIIYPENRIVVDYKGIEDLVLLDIIDNETGESLDWDSITGIAKFLKFPVVNYLALSAEKIQRLEECYGVTNGSKEEGVVVRFADGTRIKVKYSEYKRLHKLVTQCSKRSIWENMKEGKSMEELLDHVPDEFFDWVKESMNELSKEYFVIKTRAEEIFDEARKKLGNVERKDYAMEFVKHNSYTPILFAMLSAKDYSEIIWKQIKPQSTKPFHQDIDA